MKSKLKITSKMSVAQISELNRKKITTNQMRTFRKNTRINYLEKVDGHEIEGYQAYEVICQSLQWKWEHTIIIFVELPKKKEE